eukprot:4722630-Pyramimonas_sp.AAC.2
MAGSRRDATMADDPVSWHCVDNPTSHAAHLHASETSRATPLSIDNARTTDSLTTSSRAHF